LAARWRTETWKSGTQQHELIQDDSAAEISGRPRKPSWIGSLTVQQRIGSNVATATALGAFLTLCGQATTPNCAFSAGTPARTHAKFTALLARLRTGPITITLGGQKVTFTRLIISPIPSASLPGWPPRRSCPPWAARPVPGRVLPSHHRAPMSGGRPRTSRHADHPICTVASLPKIDPAAPPNGGDGRGAPVSTGHDLLSAG
jgi:hypothetical protein